MVEFEPERMKLMSDRFESPTNRCEFPTHVGGQFFRRGLCCEKPKLSLLDGICYWGLS